jgi:hypothetical protein
MRRSFYATAVALALATIATVTNSPVALADENCPNCDPVVDSGQAEGVVAGDEYYYDDGSAGGRVGLIARLRARAVGECRNRAYGNPDLFYNFWVPPTCGGVGAQLYLAPHPIPANVGHTYITYQPLMPHEMLYPHRRRYHRYYDEGRGLNRTRISWSKSLGYRAQNMAGYLRIPR